MFTCAETQLAICVFVRSGEGFIEMTVKKERKSKSRKFVEDYFG